MNPLENFAKILLFDVDRPHYVSTEGAKIHTVTESVTRAKIKLSATYFFLLTFYLSFFVDVHILCFIIYFDNCTRSDFIRMHS